jgi:hypothetical protein
MCGELVGRQNNEMLTALILKVKKEIVSHPSVGDILRRAVKTSCVWFSLHEAIFEKRDFDGIQDIWVQD